MQIYGPYTRPNGRRLVIVVDKNGKRRTVSYPKWLLEQQLGRKLDPDKETVDHIDGDLTNNDINNLRILPRHEHSAEDTRRVKWIDFNCPWCDKNFARSPRLIRDKAKKNKAGPFCSRRCAGKYSRQLQLKLIDKLAPQPFVVSEYFKKKNVTASFDYDDDDDDIFIEDLLALASKDFIYHETQKEHLPSIKNDGLLTTSYGQSLVSHDGRVMSPEEYKDMISSELVEGMDDFSEEELIQKIESQFEQDIPKADRIPRTYISEKEPLKFNYGDVLLRFPRDLAGTINKDVDYFILKDIPPEAIEVKINDSWHPLIS